jgi:hypothetical protein
LFTRTTISVLNKVQDFSPARQRSFSNSGEREREIVREKVKERDERRKSI